MKKSVLFLLRFLPLTLLLIACSFLESEDLTPTAPATAATVIHPFLSGPTPTAAPLPTRIAQEIVVTRVVESGEAEPPAGGRLLAEVPEDLEPAGESEHFTFYVERGAEAPPMDELGPTAEEIFSYVSRRLAAPYDGSIVVLFRPPPRTACRPRGMAITEPPGEQHDVPLVYIFAGDDTGRDQIMGVLAHEVAHILHARALEQGLSRHAPLNEGFAHWLSTDYVTAWYNTPSYNALVRRYLEAGTYLSLHENYQSPYPSPESGDDNCLQRRDQLYTEWASFIGFLIDSYGMEQFLALMAGPEIEQTQVPPIIYPPDYEGVYGLALNQLEVAWLRRLLGE